MTKEIRLYVRVRNQSVSWRCKLLARNRLDEVGRDDDDQLGFVLDEVPAAKQCAENWNIFGARQAVDVLARVVGNQTGKSERAAGGQFNG